MIESHTAPVCPLSIIGNANRELLSCLKECCMFWSVKDLNCCLFLFLTDLEQPYKPTKQENLNNQDVA